MSSMRIPVGRIISPDPKCYKGAAAQLAELASKACGYALPAKDEREELFQHQPADGFRAFG
jgi:hypothetical protein